MTEVNWQRVFVISALVFALLLISGSIYLHLTHKSHLGRLHHESHAVAYAAGVDAAVIEKVATTTVVAVVASTTDTYIDDVDGSEDDETIAFSLPEYENESDEYPPEEASAEMLRSSSSSQLSQESAQFDSAEKLKALASEQHITEACMQCICEAATLCRQAACGFDGAPCGIFRISRPYWVDAGKPTLEGDFSIVDADMGYAHCVNNAYCAGRTVATFVSKYARDCNHDGKIDCRDHIALHILGPRGCLLTELESVFQTRMESCLSEFI